MTGLGLGSVLPFNSQVPPGVALLSQATLWLDAFKAVEGETSARNYGTGGSALNAQYGSTSGSDTNDPLLLTHTGINYAYCPGVAERMYISDSEEDAGAVELDIRAVVNMTDWSIGSLQYFFAHGTGTNTAFTFGVSNTGQICLGVSDTGTLELLTSSSTMDSFNGIIVAVRATWRASDGETRFLYKNTTEATAAADRASNNDWVLISTTTSTTLAGLFNATTAIGITASPSSTLQMNGKFYSGSIATTIDGTPYLEINTATDITDSGATSFVATSGQTVTVERAAAGRKTALVTRPIWLFGTDDFMEIADNALLNFGASESYTVLAVARRWSTQPNGGRIIGKTGISVVSQPGWYTQASTTTVNVISGVGDGTTNVTRGVTGLTEGLLYVVGHLVDRSAETLQSIANTLSVTNTTAGIGSLSNALPVRIGSRSDVAAQVAEMELVAAAIFRRAISANELALINAYYGTV